MLYIVGRLQVQIPAIQLSWLWFLMIVLSPYVLMREFYVKWDHHSFLLHFSASSLADDSIIRRNIIWITNYVEPSPSWEAASSSTSQEFPKMLWNPKFYCRVHKSPQMDPTLSQMNPVHSIPSYFSKMHFNIIFQIMPRSSYSSFSFWVSYQNSSGMLHALSILSSLAVNY
jgi:hypothetical protein